GRLHQHRHFRRERLEVEQVFQFQRVGAEAPDGHGRPVQGQGRDDGVDTAAVGQPGVHHRAGLVHAAADLGDDAVDDLQEVVAVAELDVGLLQLAAALHVDLVRAVD